MMNIQAIHFSELSMANWVILMKENFVSLVLANIFSLCALQFSHEPVLSYTRFCYCEVNIQQR